MIPHELATLTGGALDIYVQGMFGWLRAPDESDDALRNRAIKRYKSSLGRQLQHEVFPPSAEAFNAMRGVATPTFRELDAQIAGDRKQHLNDLALPVWLQLVGQAKLLEQPHEQLQHAFKYIAATAYGLAEAMQDESEKRK